MYEYDDDYDNYVNSYDNYYENDPYGDDFANANAPEHDDDDYDEIGECEECGAENVGLHDTGINIICDECLSSFDPGPSDYQDRCHERRQLGLCDF